ncbi:hypothetical protein QQS21_004386 [Conoideocrella luteorostrata]|uniref:Rhodopsin domain-containing protein n=1 Tax=Conoideocrella luteorostrata TaxID=1105319 RepID=A0AAJ0CSF7_9HYPO|nr:hypothetical protein QQS21_004386 [Conoideocrella luteorostrata]
MAFQLNNSSTQISQFIVLLIFTPLGILVTALRFVATSRSKRKVDIEDWLAPDDYKLMRKWDMVGLYMLFGHLFTVKLSILALYRRIFGVNRVYRIWIYAFAAFLTIFIVILCITQASQCRPFGRYFDLTIPGKCLSENVIVIGGSVPDSCLDFALVVLAMFMIRQLQLSSSAKWKLRFLFGVGSLVGVIGFVKIAITYSADSLYAFSMISLWTCVQMFLSLVCACLPVYRPIMPGGALMHRFIALVTSYARAPSNTSSHPKTNRKAGDDDSTKGFAAWADRNCNRDTHHLNKITTGVPEPVRPSAIHVKREFDVRGSA